MIQLTGAKDGKPMYFSPRHIMLISIMEVHKELDSTSEIISTTVITLADGTEYGVKEPPVQVLSMLAGASN